MVYLSYYLLQLNMNFKLKYLGSRVANQILKLIPNQDNFKLTLRAVKLWAKSKP
jgi:poly(A) polymerase Pap1